MPTVSDHTALLRYLESDSSRWNGMTSVGAPVVVTYSFTETADLPSLADYNPYNSTGYWSYSAAQRDLFRDAVAEFAAAAGVIFVEVDGPSMIGVFGSTGSTVGGWATYAYSSNSYTGRGRLVNEYGDMGPGQYGMQVNLHELGHAMGLKHPHSGQNVLDPGLDTQVNTVMTYNISYPYATALGPFDIQALQHLYGARADVADWIVGLNAAGQVEIAASARSETVIGADLASVIRAGAGGDTVYGRQMDDTIYGGAGRDVVVGSLGSDRLIGGNGNDTLFGDVRDSYHLGEADTLNGGAGKDRLSGGGGDDILRGGAHNDKLFGGDGADKLHGSGGDDKLVGGDDNDTLLGGGGNDSLYGEWSHDRLVGGDGGDLLDGGYGMDTLLGGAGSDTLRGGSNADKLTGGAGNDLLKGGASYYGDTLSGGDGRDTLIGGGGSDVLDGGDGNDRLKGGTGDDLMTGGRGNDILKGGDGWDTLIGKAGDDVLIGGAGSDTLTGGGGDDTFVILTDSGWDTITDFQQGSDIIDLSALGLTFADIAQYGYNGGADTWVHLGSGMPTLIVENLAAGTLTAADFDFIA